MASAAPLRIAANRLGIRQASAAAFAKRSHGVSPVRATTARLGSDSDRSAVEIHAAHAGLGGERHEPGMRLGHLAGAQIELLLGQDHDRAAFGGFIGQGSQLGGIGQALRRDARRGMKSVAMRLPSVMVPVLSSSSTSTSPAASTARPLVAMTLRRISRSMPLMPMALSNPPMVVGIRQTSSATSTGTEKTHPGIDAERLQGHARPAER